MNMTKIATGRQGSWFADVNGRPGLQLPVLFKEYWGAGNSYHDPYPRYLETTQGKRYCMSSEHFGQLAWQFKRMSGSSGLKVQAAIAC